MKERASRERLDLDFSTNDESEYSSQTEISGIYMTAETGDFNKPELKIPETDERSKYSSLTIYMRVRMTKNPDHSAEPEVNLLRDDEISMEFSLEEGREAAREYQAQDPAVKLIFQWANANKNCRQTSPAKLNLRKAVAIAAGEDAVALWCVGEQLELAEGILYLTWLIEGKNCNVRQFVVPTSLRERVLEELHESKISRGPFAFQKTLDRARQRFCWPNL